MACASAGDVRKEEIAMLIVEDKKAIVLKLKNPERVLQVIPSAKVVTHNDEQYVEVPHRMDETRVLRNMGISAPSPVRHYYRWPGRFKPFKAQVDTTEFMTLNPRAYVLNDMGTGKTVSTLWAYDYLRSIGKAKKLLVVAPLSTLDPTWGNTIFNNFMHLSCVVLHGSREQRFELLKMDVDIYIINHDGIKVSGFTEALAARDDITHVVVDELASFRNARTDRWEVINNICNKQHERSVWGLTGTPTPNEPTDAWGQCKLLTPANITPYYGKFRDQVMTQINTYRWVARPDAVTTVMTAMKPAIRFKRDECVDLPPVLFETRHVDMSPQQAKAYKQMLTTLRMEADAGQILASNEAIKAGKLLQIACGVVYDDNGEEFVMPATERISVVEEIIENAGAKVIIFIPFKGALNHVAERLAEKWETEVIHGGVSKHKRDDVFQRFQDPKSDLRVIVAQPVAMSHGLTLTEANTIIWFAPVHSNETFQQAIARISRPGQVRNQLIVMIEGTEIERRIYKRLQHREKVQGTLLDMIKGEMNEVR